MSPPLVIDPIIKVQNTAFAMNNHGVALLSRQEYAHAHECFLEAVLLLKVSSSSDDQVCINFSKHMEPVNLSSFNRVKPDTNEKQQASAASSVHKSGLQVISDQNNAATALSLLVNSQASQIPVILPMLIELQGNGPNDLDHNNVYLHSCILLRNLGLSTVCMANDVALVESSQKESLWNKSFHLFTLSRDLLDKVTCAEGNVDLHETLLLLELLLAYDLLCTSIQLGLDIHVHNEKLESISNYIDQ